MLHCTLEMAEGAFTALQDSMLGNPSIEAWCKQAQAAEESIPSVQTAVAAAASKGVLFVSSAGNDHSNNDLTPHWPSNIASDTTISVAALDKTVNLWCALQRAPLHVMACKAIV